MKSINILKQSPARSAINKRVPAELKYANIYGSIYISTIPSVFIK